MPRSNRYIQPGHVYHLTHRCHDKEFLLRHRQDRIEYCDRLRSAVRKYGISLFNFCITCNHVHLVAMCDQLGDLSRFMQELEGEYAEHYNWRKQRSGSFWGGRFHSTMIDGGEHLWNCLRYVDLNMVRANVVSHPIDWIWAGYREIVGERKRYRLLDTDRLVTLLGLRDRAMLAEIHQKRIIESIHSKRLSREGFWTESIAVGSEAFINEIAGRNRWRKRIRQGITETAIFYIKESNSEYNCLEQEKVPAKWL